MNVVDAARASAALFEIERCLRKLRSREKCQRLDVVRPRKVSRASDPLVTEVRIAGVFFLAFLVLVVVALAHLVAPHV